MKCLSSKQPFAELLISGRKTIELRTRNTIVQRPVSGESLKADESHEKFNKYWICLAPLIRRVETKD